MILPFAHRETPFDLDAEEWWDTRELLAVARERVDRALAPHGYNVGWNVGTPGGQSIPHAHLHLVPRWADEPHAGKGMRWWIKQPDNIRPGSTMTVELQDGTGQGSRDALELLHRHHGPLRQHVQVRGLGPCHDVVGPGHGVHDHDAFDVADLRR